MIKFRTTCADGHASDIWFRDGASCDAQLAAGLVQCPVCGSTAMAKALMAPAVGRERMPAAAVHEAQAAGSPTPAHDPGGAPARPVAAPGGTRPALTPEAMRREIEGRLRALRAYVEANAENVGARFAAEARAIHDGDADPRAIFGQCTPDEAEALAEDGVPVAAIPWIDRRDD